MTSPPPTMKDIIREILSMIGQDAIYAECGGDFPECGAGSSAHCQYFRDCRRQLVRVRQTQKIREMLEEVA